MRSLLIVALAAVIATIAHASEQDKAKALEDRWPQCSEVVKGRFGAFHPFDQKDATEQWTPVCNNSVSFTDEHSSYSSVKVTYAPCAPSGDVSVLSFSGIRDSWGDDRTTIKSFSMVNMVDGRNLKFNMPLKVGDVANFVGRYSNSKGETAVVTTSCNSGIPDGRIQIISIAKANQTGTQPAEYDIQLQSAYGCAMFPYSNRAMPAGGIAALIIVLIACLGQFGIAVWYHKTQTIGENPFTTAADYTNVE
jgi:hypothetical protein